MWTGDNSGRTDPFGNAFGPGADVVDQTKVLNVVVCPTLGGMRRRKPLWSRICVEALPFHCVDRNLITISRYLVYFNALCGI